MSVARGVLSPPLDSGEDEADAAALCADGGLEVRRGL
jgi:hypothetical protein